MTTESTLRQRHNLHLFMDKPKGKCCVCGKQIQTNAFYLKHNGKVIAKVCSFDCRELFKNKN